MDRQKLEALIQDHQSLVYTIAMSYLHDAHAAEDVSQDVFIRAAGALDGVKDPAGVKSWLGRIARNRCIDYLRSRKTTLRLERIPRALPQSDEDPDRLKAVEKVLRQLRDDYRQIVLLRYVQGLSYAEIGSIVGLTPTAVGEKLHRVWRLVLEKFKEACNEL